MKKNQNKLLFKKTAMLFLMMVLFIACDKDDDAPTNPVDQLPPATQTGANTFGCLLDGEAFIPSGGINPLDCVYQFVDGGYYFGLQGNKRDMNNNRVTIALGTNNLQLQESFSYSLLDNLPGNAHGIYSFYQVNFTTQSRTGNLYITKLDTENQIVSGTFWFDVEDQNGIVHEIRDGRFDMQYSQ